MRTREPGARRYSARAVSNHPTLRALAAPGVKALALSRFVRSIAGTTLVTTLGWHIYDVSGSKVALGVLGLVEFVPAVTLGLVAGAIVDATDRVRVTVLAQSAWACAALALATFGGDDLGILLGCAFATAACAAFEFPALATILPNLVPREIFPSAVSLVATLRNLGWTLGPGVAGVAIARLGVDATYGFAAVLALASAALVARIPRAAEPPAAREISLRAIGEGIAFVRSERAVLGAMTLDLFAVLFAGATALLPVYAKDILQVGPEGFGLLRASLTAGTFLMSAILLVRPPIARAGRALCGAVAAFGLATIVFGFSRSFELSVLALMAAGMADEVSMVARNIIIQLGTPDALRGRVSAVNAVFVGASNELGAAESGFLAAATSATFAVVFGGFACLGVLAAVMRKLPSLTRFRAAPLLALAALGFAAPHAARGESSPRAEASAPAAPQANAASLDAPHHDGERFFVPWGDDEARGLGAFLRWQFSRNPYRALPRNPAPRVANDGASLARALAAGEAEITWVGHATFAVHDADGVFVTDPHFGPRALLPPRLVAPGIPLRAVPEGAFAVVSHNHYDHLDAFTVDALPADFAWFVPLGLGDWFRARGRTNVVELDWWQSARRGAFTITCVPSQHWSKRIEQSTNESLWCAWRIDSGARAYFFAGDTGYFHGFAEVSRRFGPVDAALLPIGAYAPRWFMDFQHMDPAEALRAFRDLRATTLFPMHWGTFELTDEPPDEAPRELRRQMPAAGVRDDEVALLSVGERRTLPPKRAAP
jgi:L-ascorbate metabolism protein UlaG (beta-lactamase superfamily)/MFS family permease